MNKVFEKLKDFVVKESCADDEAISSETRLVDDLGVNGDDGVAFIVAFGKEFNVDISHFMAADYFESEGDLMWDSILQFLTGQRNASRKILTVGHLEKAIIAGRLDEEVINN